MNKAGWRLIRTGPAPAGVNMAVDEALARLAPVSGFCPTLRIYRWNRPAVSIGYNQNTRGIDIGFCRARGIDIVRRPTGGRAVYHHREITYAVVAPRALFKKDTGAASYRVLGEGLLRCLDILGVSGELISPGMNGKSGGQDRMRHPGKRLGSIDQPACFLAPSRYEIGIGGKKIIGSAQRRYRFCILQQGSFLLNIDWERFLQVFSGADVSPEVKRKQGMGQRHITCLREVASREIGYEEVEEALIEGFEKAFGARMMETDLSHGEEDIVKRLVREKYSSDDWNIDRIDRFFNPQKPKFPEFSIPVNRIINEMHQ
jgi:lipoate-protein ligase A